MRARGCFRQRGLQTEDVLPTLQSMAAARGSYYSASKLSRQKSGLARGQTLYSVTKIIGARHREMTYTANRPEPPFIWHISLPLIDTGRSLETIQVCVFQSRSWLQMSGGQLRSWKFQRGAWVDGTKFLAFSKLGNSIFSTLKSHFQL